MTFRRDWARRLVAGGCMCVGFLVLEMVRAADVPRAATWPEFHGPGRTNVSPDTGLLKKWPAEGPPLVWKYSDCGIGFSGVAIAQDKIFTAGDQDEGEMLQALSLAGKLLWKTANGPAWTGACPGSRTTPTFSDGVLYHLTPRGRLAAFDAETGRERWAVDLVARFAGQHGIWAFAENVIVDGDRVLCMPGGPQGRVVALDKHTGRSVWANTQIEHPAAYCSPVVVDYGGVRQLVTLTQKSLVSLDVRDGKLLWSAPFVPRSPQNANTPVFHDGYVFVACGHSSGGTVMKVAPDFHSVTQVWWKKELDSCHSGVLLIDGRLYGSSCRQGGKQFFCADLLTGEVKQSDKTLGKAAITQADGMLYCLNHRGQVSLLAITPDGFRIASQFSLPKKPDNSYLCHPVVCGGRLYLRCDDELYAFDVRAKP